MDYAEVNGQLVLGTPTASSDPEGTVPSGRVVMTPSTSGLIQLSTGVAMVPETVELQLDDEGHVTLNGSRHIYVPTTDGGTPTWHWRVTFEIFDSFGVGIPVPSRTVDTPMNRVTKLFSDSRT